MKEKRTRKFCGLLRRREVLVPTWQGWLVLLLSTALLAVGFIRSIQPFLALNATANGGVLVAEGWVPDYVLQAAVDEFQRHDYDGFYVTGGPLDRGAPLSKYKTYAELGASVVARLGLESSLVDAVPVQYVRKDHTYASAVALKKWLGKKGRDARSLTVISLGAHARRTRLLYQMAFGPGTEIGIIAVPDRDYDASRWWVSSAGVRDVVNETVAYLYVRLLFRALKE
jgi:hypothetical protein